MRDQDRIADMRGVAVALVSVEEEARRYKVKLFAAAEVLESRDAALLALVQQWRNTGMWEFETCADQLERLITGEGK